MRDFVARLGDWTPAGPALLIGTALVSQFADLSGDHNAIHTDAVAAVRNGLPGPVAHGDLITCMLPTLAKDFYQQLLDTAHAYEKAVLNKGGSSVFHQLIPVDSSIRMVIRIDQSREGNKIRPSHATLMVEYRILLDGTLHIVQEGTRALIIANPEMCRQTK